MMPIGMLVGAFVCVAGRGTVYKLLYRLGKVHYMYMTFREKMTLTRKKSIFRFSMPLIIFVSLFCNKKELFFLSTKFEF